MFNWIIKISKKKEDSGYEFFKNKIFLLSTLFQLLFIHEKYIIFWFCNEKLIKNIRT